MLRQFACSLVALAVLASAVVAADKADPKTKTVNGTFASYKAGTLTIKVAAEKKGDEPKSMDYKIADDLKVVNVTGKEKTEAVSKEAFTSVKEGTVIVVTLGEGDKVTAVQIGVLKNAQPKGDPKPAAAAKADPKPKTVSGTFASFKDGTLTIKVAGKKGDEPKATDYKIADDIKVVTFTGKEKTEAVSKDAFTSVKEGVHVTVTLGEGDKVTAVQIGDAPKNKNVSGTFVSFKDGTLTVKVAGKKGDEPKATEFKLTDTLKVSTFVDNVKTEGVAKDAFTNVKEATPVSIVLSPDDKVISVQVGSATKK